MIAIRGFGLWGEDFMSFSPLFVLVLIVDSITVRLVDCLTGQPIQIVQIIDHLVVC